MRNGLAVQFRFSATGILPNMVSLRLGSQAFLHASFSIDN